MHILVVSQYFWPENFKINELVLTWIKEGHEVTVLTGNPNYPEGHYFKGYFPFFPFSENWNGARIVRAPIISRGPGRGVRLALNYLSYAISASIVGLLTCRKNVDVLFVFEPSPVTVGIPAVILKKVLKRPLLFWVQDLWPESLSATGTVKSPVILGLVAQLVKWIYKNCDQILVQSQAFIPEVANFGIAADKISFFPNFAEPYYRPLAPQESVVPLPSGFKVMFAGNIGAAQDFESIIEAARELREHKDIHWLIVGDGRMKIWAQDTVKQLGLTQNFHFLGRYPAEKMPEFFAHADGLLVTLKDEPVFAKTIPAKLQSYLACGKPIIAGLGGEGARIARESGAAVVALPSDPHSLAEAILKLKNMSTEERLRLGQNGRNYFEANFEFTALMSQLEGWLQAAKKDHS